MKVKCGNCKKYIERDTSVHAGINYFCDADCLSGKRMATAKKVSEKRKMDLGSTHKTKKQRRISRTKRDSNDVFERDGFRCRYCGGRNNLIVHHVIYRSEIRNRQWKDELSNLLTLCNEPCHLSIIHSNKKKYQPLCLQIIWLREINGDKTTLIKDIE